jgi:hypothetical protein
VDVCVYSVSVRWRPSDGLIPRPRSSADSQIKKLECKEAFYGCPVFRVGATGIEEEEEEEEEEE